MNGWLTDDNGHQQATADVTKSAIYGGSRAFAPRTVDGQSPETNRQQRMVSAQWQYDRHTITVHKGQSADTKWTVIRQ